MTPDAADLLTVEETMTIISKSISAYGGQATEDDLKRVTDWAMDTRVRAAMLELTLTTDTGLAFTADDGDIVIKALR